MFALAWMASLYRQTLNLLFVQQVGISCILYFPVLKAIVYLKIMMFLWIYGSLGICHLLNFLFQVMFFLRKKEVK